MRCDGNARNSFPTTQGKDPSCRARRQKRGSCGCGRDSPASSLVETGMSGNSLSCSKGPKSPPSTQPSHSTECPRRGQRSYGRVYVWDRPPPPYLGRHPYTQKERALCLCAYACIYSHTHTHTHAHRGMGLNHQKGMKSHSLQELGETFRGDDAP